MQQKAKCKPKRAMSIYDFFKQFPNAETAREYIEQQRWQGNSTCPHCNSTAIGPLPSKKGFWHCSACRKQFSAISGTIFHNSQVPLDKWLYAIYRMAIACKGEPSIQISEELGITQKTSWHMCHRIREAMCHDNYSRQLEGNVECDETFLGGLEKNKHPGKRLHQGGGTAGKQIVWGCIERGSGRLIARVIDNTGKKTLQEQVRRFVKSDSVVNTDGALAYKGLSRWYTHKEVCHKAYKYVEGDAYTNGMEGAWNILKKRYHGTFHQITPEHLQRYVDEFAFRWNHRNSPTMQIIETLVQGCFGRRLPYNALVGNGLALYAGKI